MNFEELENAWAAQAVPSAGLDAAALQRSAEAGLRRRSRLLTGAAIVLVFGLLVYPALSLANFRYLHPRWPVLFWANVALHVALLGTLLAWVLRRLARHRALRCRQTATVREFAAGALAGTEAEIRDFRVGIALIPVFGVLALVSGYLNNADHYAWRLFATQALVSLAILAPIISAAVRDYRVNLKPRRDALRSLLHDSG